MEMNEKYPIYLDWFMISGFDVGFDWDYDERWLTLNFGIIRIVWGY